MWNSTKYYVNGKMWLLIDAEPDSWHSFKTVTLIKLSTECIYSVDASRWSKIFRRWCNVIAQCVLFDVKICVFTKIWLNFLKLFSHFISRKMDKKTSGDFASLRWAEFQCKKLTSLIRRYGHNPKNILDFNKSHGIICSWSMHKFIGQT